MIDSGARDRCPWGQAPDDLREYHDTEWGRPALVGLEPGAADRVAFERLTLEAMQSGLSWLTILRRRDSLRRAYANFDPHLVAAFGPDDVERLMADPGVIRNHAKVTATISNARVLAQAHARGDAGDLAQRFLAASGEPGPPPATMADVPSVTPQSRRLAADLKRAGWRFVGPTTCYAALQALGVVNDHLAMCFARGGPEAATGIGREE